MSLLLAAFIIFSPLPLAMAATYFWLPRQRARLGELPVKEMMLRSPGETLRRKIMELEEKLQEDIVVISIGPVIFTASYLVTRSQHGWTADSAWWLFMVINTAIIVWRGKICLRRLHELRNYELGYTGELLVAERIAPLARRGFLIYHDCPADEHGNIDHIVVTPSTVYAIETKTRRKRRAADPKRSPADVIYDGAGLDFPHGREDFGLAQARRQARWLSSFLSRALAEEVDVKAVLALPGWMVKRIGRGDVTVVNPKEIPGLMREASTLPLDPAIIKRMQQIEFILDGRCRDVAFGRVTQNN